MSRAVPIVAGVVLLALVWLGPLPRLASSSFTAHMLMHMSLVAGAAPLLALGLRDRLPPMGPMLASLADLVVVWAWHMPRLHDAARSDAGWMVVEQASFLFVGLALWLSALDRGREPGAALAGAAALFFTSMHMTLLGVLLALAPLPLFHSGHGDGLPLGLSPAEDRELGGVLMLAVGGTVYLLGGLALVARVLRPMPPRRHDP